MRPRMAAGGSMRKSIFLPLSVTTEVAEVQVQLSLLTDRKVAEKGPVTLFQRLVVTFLPGSLGFGVVLTSWSLMAL